MLSICGIKSNFSVAILILVKSSASFIFPLNTIALNTCNPPIKFVFPDEFGPYITDDDAFDDAMKTIKDSFDKGAYAVELECGYIVENSDMYNLYKNGRYKPLSFWSIQKLLKNAIALNRGIVRLAYFSDTPKPIAGPSNCEKCNDKFIKMFDEYRETLDPKVLFEEIQCECKKYIIR